MIITLPVLIVMIWSYVSEVERLLLSYGLEK